MIVQLDHFIGILSYTTARNSFHCSVDVRLLGSV